MNLSEIEQKYDHLINHLCDDGVPTKEAERLATVFFKAAYEINKVLRHLGGEANLLEQAANALYTDAINKAEGKNITEKKLNATGNIEYCKVTKQFNNTKNNYEYFKRLYELMNKGHLFYKSLSREV